jgi:cytochrome c oxidase assembly protein subunit 15
LSATGASTFALRAWLWAVAGLVLAMVTVGGATRLTGSGLSITEWQPILGAIPPLTHADWMVAFDKYRQIAQYKLINKGMSLEAFQFIYWWEWAHRQLGRFIGLAYGLPLLVFWLRGAIPKGYGLPLLGLLLLGGLQGAIGWYMVQSGLTDRTSVSQYRLALHLTVAALILAGLVRVALSLAADARPRVRLNTVPPHARALSAVLMGAVLLQIALGAFVAGTQAGLAHNTWPLMDGRIIPSGLFAMTPAWANLFENVATIQFNHRMAAYAIVGLVGVQVALCARGVDDEIVSRSAWALLAVTLAQVGLGIWTLLAMVPLWLGLAHQALAFILLGVAVWHRFAIVRRA